MIKVRTNVLAPNVTIEDLGIIIPGAGGEVTLTTHEEIGDAMRSNSLRQLATDSAYGGSSTLILNNGVEDISMGVVDNFLKTADLPTTGGYSVPLRDAGGTSASNVNWQQYATNCRYTGASETIVSGIVMVALYGAVTVYRFISDSMDMYGYPDEDSFYSIFQGGDLSGLIVTRGNI